MKKIISIILAFSLSISCLAYVSADDEISGTYTPDYKYRILHELGVVNENEISSPVSRGEFVVWAVRMFGYEDEAINYSGERYFIDVPDKHSASSYINFACERGYINGTGNGKFRPDDKIKPAEAVSIVLNAANWNEYLTCTGQYPYSYLQTASQLKMLSEVDRNAEYLDTENAIALLYNSLSLHYLEVTDIESDSYTFESKNSDTVLGRAKDFKLYEGVVTADRFSSLYGAGLYNERRIEIDGITYYTEKSAFGLLAKNVVYLINDDDDKKISYMTEMENDDIVKVNAENFTEFKNNKFYYEENGTSKSISLKDNIPVVKNGAFLGILGTSSVKDEELYFDSGSITFSDYDSDGTVNAVIIENCETVVAEHIGVSAEIIYGKYADKKIFLSSDDTDIEYRIEKDGKEIGLAEIIENNVLSIWKIVYDGGEFYNITVSDKTVSGTLESITDDARGGNCVTINGTSYPISEDYYKNGKYADNAEKMEIGTNVTAYLNANGKVALCESNSNKELFGYLVALKPDTIDDSLKLKIFSSNGKFVYTETEPKLVVNGSKTASPLSAIAVTDDNGNVSYNQLIKYKLNDKGKVKEIITENGGFDCNLDSQTARIHPVAYTINHLYKIDSDTKIFSVPEDLTYDDGYKIIEYAKIQTEAFKLGDANVETDFKVSVYDCDDEYNAGAVVFENYNTVINNYAQWLASIQFRLMIVKSVKNIYDSKSGDTVRTISGIKDGKETECKLDETYDNVVIKPGDMLRISIDSDNWANALYREFSYSDDTLFAGNNTATGFREKANGNVFGPDVLYYYGKAGKMVKGKILFAQLSEYPRRLEYTTGKTIVYLFDTDKNTVRQVNFDEITENDTIYAHTHKSVLYEVVIYR